MTTGERIKNARKSAGLTQQELGDKLGVSGSMIGQYETDRRNPKHETIEKIAEALNVSPSSLYDKVSWVRTNGYFAKGFSNVLGTLQCIYEDENTPITIKKLIDSNFSDFYSMIDETSAVADSIINASLGTVLNEDLMMRNSKELKLILLFRNLNESGQEFAVDYIAGLSENKRYIKSSEE